MRVAAQTVFRGAGRGVAQQPVARWIAPVASAASTSSSSRIPLSQLPFSLNHRAFSASTSLARSPDPGGKPNDGSHSTVYDDFYNMLESEEDMNLSVAAVAPNAITMSDGLVLQSPVFLLNGTCFMWDPPALDPDAALPNGRGWEEWDANKQDIFQILDVVEPKPEVLIFGTGKTVLPLPPPLRSHLNNLGIQVDVQSTHNASSTFNVLVEEGRKVALALLPAERGEIPKTKMTSKPSPSDSDAGSSSSSSSAASQTSDAPSGARSMHTSARQSLAQPASPVSPSNSQASASSRRARTMDSKGPALTLKHFMFRTEALELYRSYLRATRSIPNPIARWETIDFFRQGFESTRFETDLERIRDNLARAGRELKMNQGSMLLSNDGGNASKLRGRRGRD